MASRRMNYTMALVVPKGGLPAGKPAPQDAAAAPRGPTSAQRARLAAAVEKGSLSLASSKGTYLGIKRQRPAP